MFLFGVGEGGGSELRFPTPPGLMDNLVSEMASLKKELRLPFVFFANIFLTVERSKSQARDRFRLGIVLFPFLSSQQKEGTRKGKWTD